MNPVAYSEVLRSLGAEAVLTVAALVALTFDLGWGRRMDLRSRTRLVGLFALFGTVLALIPLLQSTSQGQGSGLGEVLVLDSLAIVFKSIILVLTGLTVLLSMESDIGQHIGEYYAIMLFGAIGMLVLVAAEELITIFVALELLSISLYILTASHKSALRSQEAALKYFMFGAISSAFLLFGMSYLVGITGTTHLRQMSEAISAGGALTSIAVLFILVGFGFKVAVVPFHLWAPDAYEGAPTPVTAYIATGSKVASFVVLLRVLFVGLPGAEGSALWGQTSSGWGVLLVAMAAFSMILGNVVAIVQTNVKRLLAYSSIAHAGYIFIGLVAAKTTGATAVLFYVLVYALTNLGAFGVIAVLARSAGGEELHHFNGMARRAPFLSLLMLVFILSLAGVPPLGGFFGKFYLFAAAVQRDAETFGLLWLVVLGILMSAVSLYYYLVVLKHFYVVEATDATPVETAPHLKLGLGLVALAVVLLGAFPQPVLTLLNHLVSRL